MKENNETTILDEILKQKNAFKVYNDLDIYTKTQSKDWFTQARLKQSLFYHYLIATRDIEKKDNFYEEIILRIGAGLQEETMEFILSQPLNLNYGLCDMCGYIDVKTFLALSTDYPKIMKLVINKLGDQLYYYNSVGTNTDLCCMNIKAHDLEAALKIFNKEEFYLLPKEVEKLTNQELKKHPEGIHIDEFHTKEHDHFSKIVYTLNNSTISKEEKELFLNQILYSSKLKVFNIELLNIIQNILNKDNYQKFIEYLIDKVEQDKITICKDTAPESTIWYYCKLFYVSVEELYQKQSNKKDSKLTKKLTPPKNNRKK